MPIKQHQEDLLIFETYWQQCEILTEIEQEKLSPEFIRLNEKLAYEILKVKTKKLQVFDILFVFHNYTIWKLKKKLNFTEKIRMGT